jgi:plastocyanin
MTGTVREVAAFEDKVNQDSTLTGPRGHLVRPAYVLVNKGDTVKWVNCTNEGLKLLVSGLSIEATSGQGQDLSIQIPTNANTGVYDYDLWTTTDKPFKGESKPEIIVK